MHQNGIRKKLKEKLTAATTNILGNSYKKFRSGASRGVLNMEGFSLGNKHWIFQILALVN